MPAFRWFPNIRPRPGRLSCITINAPLLLGITGPARAGIFPAAAHLGAAHGFTVVDLLDSARDVAFETNPSIPLDEAQRLFVGTTEARVPLAELVVELGWQASELLSPDVRAAVLGAFASASGDTRGGWLRSAGARIAALLAGNPSAGGQTRHVAVTGILTSELTAWLGRIGKATHAGVWLVTVDGPALDSTDAETRAIPAHVTLHREGDDSLLRADVDGLLDLILNAR